MNSIFAELCYRLSRLRSIVLRISGCDLISVTHILVFIYCSLIIPSALHSIIDENKFPRCYRFLLFANCNGIYYGYLFQRGIKYGANRIMQQMRDYMNKFGTLEIDRIIIKAMALNSKAQYEEIICNICKEAMALDHTACLLHCGHSFHSICVNEWEEIKRIAKSTATCPSCRREFREYQKWPLDYCVSKVGKHSLPS
eukprot:108750_1